MEGLVSLGSTITCVVIEELNFARQLNENFLIDLDEKKTRDRGIWVTHYIYMYQAYKHCISKIWCALLSTEKGVGGKHQN